MPFKASGRRSRQFQASSTPTGQVGSSRLAAGQHQLLEQVLPVRLPALKAFHCRCQYQLQASSGWLAVGLACQGQLLAAGLAMPFKASSRPSRQFQASSRPTPGLRGGFALAFARLETLPLPLPIPTPGLQRLACCWPCVPRPTACCWPCDALQG